MIASTALIRLDRFLRMRSKVTLSAQAYKVARIKSKVRTIRQMLYVMHISCSNMLSVTDAVLTQVIISTKNNSLKSSPLRTVVEFLIVFHKQLSQKKTSNP